MPSESANFALLQFSTAGLPVRERVPFWREAVSREYCHIETEPLSDAPFEAEISLSAMPGLRTLASFCAPSRHVRTPELVAKGDDSIALSIKLSGQATLSQRGREASLGAGDAAVVLHGEPATIIQSHVRARGLLIPRAALAPLVNNVEDLAMRVIPRSNKAVRLLKTYLQSVHADLAVATPALRRLVATHVQDLMAMAIGTTQDGAEIARERGVRAARLAAIKTDVMAHLGDGALAIDAVAARHGLSRRSVQLLFEHDGRTFSQFLHEQRLALAHRLLGNPGHAQMTVNSIALAAGFNDLSYFNRSFRRRYGMTPSDVRAGGPRRAH
jgi:AraC-like DNA-binding protein